MYKMKLKREIWQARARMLRIMLGDWYCFSFHTQEYLGGGEDFCKNCDRVWQNDRCVSRGLKSDLIALSRDVDSTDAANAIDDREEWSEL